MLLYRTLHTTTKRKCGFPSTDFLFLFRVEQRLGESTDLVSQCECEKSVPIFTVRVSWGESHILDSFGFGFWFCFFLLRQCKFLLFGLTRLPNIRATEKQKKGQLGKKSTEKNAGHKLSHVTGFDPNQISWKFRRSMDLWTDSGMGLWPWHVRNCGSLH